MSELVAYAIAIEEIKAKAQAVGGDFDPYLIAALTYSRESGVKFDRALAWAWDRFLEDHMAEVGDLAVAQILPDQATFVGQVAVLRRAVADLVAEIRRPWFIRRENEDELWTDGGGPLVLVIDPTEWAWRTRRFIRRVFRRPEPVHRVRDLFPVVTTDPTPIPYFERRTFKAGTAAFSAKERRKMSTDLDARMDQAFLGSGQGRPQGVVPWEDDE